MSLNFVNGINEAASVAGHNDGVELTLAIAECAALESEFYTSQADLAQLDADMAAFDTNLSLVESVAGAVEAHGLTPSLAMAIQADKQGLVSSMESLDSASATTADSEVSVVALEGLKDSMKKAWEAIKKFFAKIKKFFADMFSKVISIFKKKEDIFATFKKKLDGATLDPDHKNLDKEVTVLKNKFDIKVSLEEVAKDVTTFTELLLKKAPKVNSETSFKDFYDTTKAEVEKEVANGKKNKALGFKSIEVKFENNDMMLDYKEDDKWLETDKKKVKQVCKDVSSAIEICDDAIAVTATVKLIEDTKKMIDNLNVAMGNYTDSMKKADAEQGKWALKTAKLVQKCISMSNKLQSRANKVVMTHVNYDQAIVSAFIGATKQD